MTPAGIAFAAQLRIAFVELELAVEMGLAASRHNVGILSVGYSPWLDPSILKSVGQAIADRLPGIQAEFQSRYSICQIPQIRSGQLDAGIVLLPIDVEGLVVEAVRVDTLTLALPQGHRFVDQAELKFSDVGQEPLIWIGRSVHPALAEHLIESCLFLGLHPNIVHEVTTVQEALHLVASGVGLSFVGSKAEHAFHMTRDVPSSHRRFFEDRNRGTLSTRIRSAQRASSYRGTQGRLHECSGKRELTLQFELGPICLFSSK